MELRQVVVGQNGHFHDDIAVKYNVPAISPTMKTDIRPAKWVTVGQSSLPGPADKYVSAVRSERPCCDGRQVQPAFTGAKVHDVAAHSDSDLCRKKTFFSWFSDTARPYSQ